MTALSQTPAFKFHPATVNDRQLPTSAPTALNVAFDGGR